MMESPAQEGSLTGRWLGLLLLAYLLAAVGAIVLAPFSFEPVSFDRMMWIAGQGERLADMVLNVVLFVPVGFALGRLTGSRIGAVAAGIACSIAIEGAQLAIPGRYTTLSDVLTNGVGTLLGVLLAAQAVRLVGVGREMLGRLFLDLPLMGLVYLLVPQLWLAGMTAAGDSARIAVLIALAGLGGGLIAAAGRSSGAEYRFSGGLLGWAALWGAVATLPGAVAGLTVPVAGAAAAAAGALLSDRIWVRIRRSDRRIEPAATVGAMLLLFPCLAMAARDFSAGAADRVTILRGLELLAGMVVSGYLVAEWSGRRLRRDPTAVVLSGLTGSAAAAMVGGSSAAIVAGIAASLGAGLYRLHRKHVRELLGQN